MPLYFLSYDLRKKRDYQKLYDELEKFKAVRVLESLWCFKKINTNSTELRDHFKKLIDSDDGIAVMQVSNWATYKANSTPNDLK